MTRKFMNILIVDASYKTLKNSMPYLNMVSIGNDGIKAPTALQSLALRLQTTRPERTFVRPEHIPIKKIGENIEDTKWFLETQRCHR
ncbi:hypothetical protein VTP01DRAFT_5442 [Rhizomucor pusillus]|uniref:uncharacterized protein n=1 Tax=Rhizomucor pusillus TaxID=4840 RepID=UPI0037446E66